MNNYKYITTTIPYVNGKPHIGFALELVQSDALARFYRLAGHRIRFQTGTDENATKNAAAAEKLNLTTQELVDQNASLFKSLAKNLNLTNDDFVRTTEPRHRVAVNKFWELLDTKDIYQKDYEGLYCFGCEDFVLERNLVNGKCKDHLTAPESIKEKNLFFRLSKYQTRLINLIEKDQLVIKPLSRKNEVLAFLRAGLHDISLTRSAQKAKNWGIRCPQDESQIIYVWIDALINYLTGLGFGKTSNWETFWGSGCQTTHVVGKNVWKFHAIYWPALLLSARLHLPNEILVHGFITEDGQKISKSLGSAIDPNEFAQTFGSDAVRYYLLRYIPTSTDGDFSLRQFEETYNKDLAGGIGNLFSRLLSLNVKLGGKIAITNEKPKVPKKWTHAIEAYDFAKLLKAVWAELAEIDEDISATEPWKANPRDEKVQEVIHSWINRLYEISYWLQPIIPEASQKILNHLLKSASKLSQPLYPRLK